MFATFAIGEHPDPMVQEEGVCISMHAIICSRSRPSWTSGVPVAFVSRHALQRLYERGHNVTFGNATSLLAWIAAGYLTTAPRNTSAAGFSDVMVAGGLHRFMKTQSNGRPFEESFFDVRTVLPTDEIGAGRAHQLEQGGIVADVIAEWFENADGPSVKELAEKIPFLPKREDHYPTRAARSI